MHHPRELIRLWQDLLTGRRRGYEHPDRPLASGNRRFALDEHRTGNRIFRSRTKAAIRGNRLAGNKHLSITVPLNAAFTADQPPDAPLPGDFELFIVDGNAYTRIGGEGEAVQDNSYLTMLAETLNGPEGPGLWLNILPEEDYTPAGTETRGGFTTTKYTVEGNLEKGAVNGTIWVDNKSGALVGAELTVSEGLFFPPGSNGSGGVRITLTVQQATVPAITLP